MKIKRAVKTALAVALSAVITFGIVGGSAVKSYAGFTYCSHHDEQDLFIPQGGSVTVTGTKSDVQPVNVITGSVTGIGTEIFVDYNFSGNDFTITVSAANTATIGHHQHIDISHEGENIRLYIKVTERVDPVNNPGNGGDTNNGGGEDPALRTLPPTGPDGHQHDWHWEYGSTYHCSICNTFYTVYPAHDHQYEWYVTKPATETDDGEAHHMCKICGAVDMKEPVGAYYLFSQNTENKINKAPLGGTVNVETYRWLSFQGYVLDALAKRPDVTLNVTFRENGYKGGEVKTVTIPAGYDAASLKDANGYCGFKYLAGVFGAN